MNVVSASRGGTGKWPSCGLRRILSPCGPEEFRAAGPMAIKGGCRLRAASNAREAASEEHDTLPVAKVSCVAVTDAAQFSVAAGHEFRGLLPHDRSVIQLQPKLFDPRGNLTKFRGGRRLDQIRIGPQLIRLLNIGFEAR